jgi:hypothetical protein
LLTRRSLGLALRVGFVGLPVRPPAARRFGRVGCYSLPVRVKWSPSITVRAVRAGLPSGGASLVSRLGGGALALLRGACPLFVRRRGCPPAGRVCPLFVRRRGCPPAGRVCPLFVRRRGCPPAGRVCSLFVRRGNRSPLPARPCGGLVCRAGALHSPVRAAGRRWCACPMFVRRRGRFAAP